MNWLNVMAMWSPQSHTLQYVEANVHHVVLRLVRLSPARVVANPAEEVCLVQSSRLTFLVHAVQRLSDQWVSELDAGRVDLKLLSHDLDVGVGDVRHGLTSLELVLVAGVGRCGLLHDLVLEVLFSRQLAAYQGRLVLDGLIIESDTL